MEIDIGNLVYIIFIAIIFLLNIFTKSKKKQQQNRPNSDDPTTVGPPPVNKGKTFEELLEEFTGAKPEPVQTAPPAPRPEPKPQPVPQPVPVAQQHRAAPRPAVAQQKKEHSIMKTSFGRFDEFEEEERDTQDYAAAFSNLDSAKQAFIYSEIFKKKY